jgi:ParB family chromosome partitioning protein
MSKKTPIPSFARVAGVGSKERTAAAQKAPIAAGGLRRPGTVETLEAAMSSAAAPEAVTAPAAPLAPVSDGSLRGQPRTIDTVRDLATVTVGETVLLSTQLVGDNPDNARELYNSTEVEQTGLSIQRNKQDAAANGWIQDGKVLLRDGGKRVRGARAFSVPHLLVRIERAPKDRIEAWLSSRRMNLERSTQTVYDDAIRFKQYLAEGVVESQAQLATLISEPGEPPRSAGYISQIVAIAAIPRSIMARLVEVPALRSKNAAFELSRLYTPEGQQRLIAANPSTDAEDAGLALAEQVVEQVIAAAVADKELPSAQVKKIVERAMGESRRAPRAQTSTEAVKLSSWNAKLTTIPQHRLLRVEFHDIDEGQIEALRAKVKALFEGAR